MSEQAPVDLAPGMPCVRAQCMNPSCPEFQVVVELPAVHLGANVWFVPGPLELLCGACDNYGPMNRLFGKRAQ